MSPESNPLDTFNSSDKPPSSMAASRLSSYTPENTLPPIFSSQSPGSKSMRVLPSPPVSPWTGHQHKVNHNAVKTTERMEDGATIRDPVLYPSMQFGEATTSNQPLFTTTPERLVAETLVAQHMARHPQHFDNKADHPTRDEYLLALSLVSNVGKMYNRNPGAYLKRTREETDEYYSKAKRICARPGTTTLPVVKIAPAPSHVSRQPKKMATPARPSKAKPFTRVRRTPKSSPLESALSPPVLDRLCTPESRGPAMKRPEDVDYNSLPDFSPPTSTLPAGNSKCLKTDWASNNPLDLSNDPDRHLLHEAEVNLASTLRLTCATYLCSKRRIFEGRLRAFRNKKEFRKTDAQQACKIDVNKASKLWTAYDKVGWFNKGYLERFL
ncbi:hypothetical protein MMC13_008367 [Lambiella insularis]|nr:hypothetical protein [Lambiella insularis]